MRVYPKDDMNSKTVEGSYTIQGFMVLGFRASTYTGQLVPKVGVQKFGFEFELRLLVEGLVDHEALTVLGPRNMLTYPKGPKYLYSRM